MMIVSPFAQVSDLCEKQSKFVTSAERLKGEVINFDCFRHKSETCAIAGFVFSDGNIRIKICEYSYPNMRIFVLSDTNIRALYIRIFVFSDTNIRPPIRASLRLAPLRETCAIAGFFVKKYVPQTVPVKTLISKKRP